MAEKTIKVAGFGGQGVMMFGKLLAYAATKEGKYSLWFPSYGPETRGGTANCAVIVSEEVINSPVFRDASHTVVFNLPSLEKFNDRVEDDSLLLYNASLIEKEVKNDKALVVGVPCNKIANDLGNPKVLNMVMLGAYLALTKLFTAEVIETVLKEYLGDSKAAMLDVNKQAIKAGMDFIEEAGISYA